MAQHINEPTRARATDKNPHVLDLVLINVDSINNIGLPHVGTNDHSVLLINL